MAGCGDDFSNQLGNGLKAALVGIVIGGSIFLAKEIASEHRKLPAKKVVSEQRELPEKKSASEKGKKGKKTGNGD